MTLYNPINKFYNKLNNLEEKQIIDFDINKSISSFINAAISIIESTTYSQLNYYPQQTFYLGNNLSPIKMITLYLAFLVSIKDIIKTEKKYLESNPTENFGPYQASFSFCLTPVRYQNVEVKVVFEDDNYNDRLLIVQCPIKDFFDPLFMTFSLCHEESHFVGAYIRKRKYRADCIFSLFSNEIILALFNRINYAKYKYYDINKMMDYVGKLIELEKDSFKDKINNSNKGDSSIYYFNEFSKLLINIILNFFNNLSLDSERFSIIYQDKVENSAIIYQYREEWEKISKQLIINQKKIISNMFIENTMEYTKNIFSETFADQLAVKLLDINNEEYIKIIKGSLSNKKYDDYLDLVYLRCSIIFKVNKWELLNTDDDNFINNLNVYNTCYDRYIRGEKISWPSNIFASPFVIKKVVEYLSKCNEAIECAILKDNEDKLKDLRKLKNSDTFLDNFNDLINSFKDRVIFGIYDRNDV